MRLVQLAIEKCERKADDLCKEWHELLDRATGEPWDDVSVKVTARRFAAAVVLYLDWEEMVAMGEPGEVNDAVRTLALELPDKFESDLAAALGRCKTARDRDAEDKHIRIVDRSWV